MTPDPVVDPLPERHQDATSLPPLSIDEAEIDDGERITIEIDGAPVAEVLNYVDFPCVDEDEAERCHRLSVDLARQIVHRVNTWEQAIQSLRDLLPIAVRMQSACDSGETLSYDNEHDYRDADEYAEVIRKARAALQIAESGEVAK